ncbi:hypothetical protein IMSHALPRED_004679 [Imshaugia aleurites]|uniref:ribonuclease H n=1 Tax=Imshaugia aleurites TaxID=172621 RepID=A0A8H3F6S1_9LECA|nr:hypothetical protein IMSHALPRED_004679 [Imshaugia aleurites]
MPYTMSLHAHGGSRPNHPTGPIGAAAVTMTNKYHHLTTQTTLLTGPPPPTTQRAHLSAIILALELALTKSQQLRRRTPMDVTIHTDSKYAFGCMTQWWRKWMRNGFRSARNREIANRDLVERALVLEGMVLGAGTVEWVWVPRSRNEVAGEVVEGLLDRMEDGEEDEDEDEGGPIWESWGRGGG